jgi:hypothetical protein
MQVAGSKGGMPLKVAQSVDVSKFMSYIEVIMHLIRMLYFLFSNHISNGVLFVQLGPIELFQEKKTNKILKPCTFKMCNPYVSLAI